MIVLIAMFWMTSILFQFVLEMRVLQASIAYSMIGLIYILKIAIFVSVGIIHLLFRIGYSVTLASLALFLISVTWVFMDNRRSSEKPRRFTLGDQSMSMSLISSFGSVFYSFVPKIVALVSAVFRRSLHLLIHSMVWFICL